MYQRLLFWPLFSYYCSECFTLLHVATELIPVECSTELGYCPECGQPLQQTLDYRRGYAPSPELGHISTKIVPDRKRIPPLIFQPASSLLGLTLGISKVDSILGGLRKPAHVLILGDLSNTLVERLCVRALLPRESGGMNTDPIFIDGGNCSDPYLFVSFARQYQIEPKQALLRVLTSRAFTVYQLVNLVVKELPRILRKRDSKIVIIASLLKMFDDPQIPRPEAERIIEKLSKTVQRMKDEEKLTVVSTVLQKNTLAKLIMNRADIVLQIESEKRHSARVSLLKSPDRKPSSIAISQGELGVVRPQQVLKEVAAYG